MAENDYLIPEYEKAIEEAKKLKTQIDHPELGRLLCDHLSMEKRFKELINEKVRNYLAIKRIIEDGYQLLKIEINAIKTKGVKTGYSKGEWSEAGHPKIYYGIFSFPITTARNANFTEISPKEFMEELLKDPEQNFDI